MGYYKRYYNSVPYFTTAKFDSVCAETGKPIKKGESIAYYPADKKAYCETSQTAKDLRGQMFADNCGLGDAGY
jgi:hypothetical protein